MVSVVSDNLGAGIAPSEILASYPSLGRESLRGALAHAADRTGEGTLHDI